MQASIFLGIIIVVVFLFLYFDNYYWEKIKKPTYTEEQLLENIKRVKLEIKSIQQKGNFTREQMDYKLDVLDYWEHEYERTKKYNEKHNKSTP